MKPLVIYHAHCTDGFGAAFAAWLKLGDNAEYLPMEYGQGVGANLPMFEGREVYILDFSFPREVMDALFQHAKRVVWLDHHKTAFEMWCGGVPPIGYYYSRTTALENHYILLDNYKSGALLAWEYFHPDKEVPMLIRHIDDRDRWQFKLEGSKELHAALASLKPWTFEMWDFILAETSYRANDDTGIEDFYDNGAAILRTHNQHVQEALKQTRICTVSFKEQPPGVLQQTVFRDGLAANAPTFLASDLGHELANKSGTFGLVWSMAADGQVHCSLRSNGEYDVSAIAKAFGGGGHRNAAGFSVEMSTLLEWLK